MIMEQYERPSIKLVSSILPSKGGQTCYKPPLTDIEGISTNTLVKQYGSPLFVVSEKKIRENIREAKLVFNRFYPKIQFAWSYKTNYFDEVCKVFHQEGSIAEVVSSFELEKALRNGMPGNKIIFNGPNKKKEDLINAIHKNVIIHIDNFDELYLLESLTEHLNVPVNTAIRLNMKTGTNNEWERFGFNYENNEAFSAAKRIINSKYLKLIGIHCHIGTFILSTTPYKVAAQKMVQFALRLRKELNTTLDYIDMGGGFASQNSLKTAYNNMSAPPSLSNYAESITKELFNSEFCEEERPTLVLETGRALIDNAVTLLASVLSSKMNRTGHRLLTIDAGVNLLYTSFWYNHEIVPTKPYSDFYEDTTVYGPLCMNIDVIRESVLLPAVTKDDVIAILNVGAYNMTQWMQFINLHPAVVMIKADGSINLLKEKDSTDSVNY